MPYTSPRVFSSGYGNNEHDAKVVPNAVPQYPASTARNQNGNSVYQYKVVCSCQFEVLCKTEEEANAWKAQHLRFHGVVTVEAVSPTSSNS